MTKRVHEEAGHFITARRRSLAKTVITRLYERQPSLRDRYGEQGQQQCLQDTVYHLDHLATAVTFGSPKLFSHYLAWAKATLLAHGVAWEDVANHLDILREVLVESLPKAMADALPRYLGPARPSDVHSSSGSPSLLKGEDGLSRLARRYLASLLASDRREASRLVMECIDAGVAIDDLYLQVFQRCQWEVGRLWQLREISIAQEHYCTAATQIIMSQLYSRLFAQPRHGKRMVATSVGGELHEIGLRIVTDLFELSGWITHYLGANLPPESVIDVINRFRPDLLAISTTMAVHVPKAQRLIALARASEVGATLRIMVGGGPFNVDADLWQRVGADGYASDASDAVSTAARLLNLPEPAEPLGRQVYPADLMPDDRSGESHPPPRPASTHDTFSQLNNELITAQRELAQRKIQLEQLNQQLAETNRRQEELLIELARDALILANVHDAVIATDLAGGITYWNEGATRLLGVSLDDLHRSADRMPEALRTLLARHPEATNAGTNWDGEFEVVRDDHSRLWLDARLRPMRNTSGDVIGVLVVAHDITSRKRFEEQVRQSHVLRTVGRLASGIAHSFNNLMTIVLGHGELLTSALPKESRLLRSVDAINTSATRAASLTQKLLAYSRQQMLTITDVNLQEVLEEVEAWSRESLRTMSLEVVVVSEPLTVQTDEAQLAEGLRSLVQRVAEEMPDGGRLTIRTATVTLDESATAAFPEVSPGGYALLRITVTGSALTADTAAALFEPFAPSAGMEVSSEVGLAAVYGFVKQCGGHLDVVSEPDSGTTFRLYLPLTIASAEE